MRNIGVVTVGRSDYGIYTPLLRAIQADPDLNLHLIVSGMHLSPEFGLTANLIEKDGFEIGQQVEMLLSSDTPEGIAKSMGLGLIGFSQAFAGYRPDIIVVLGDRFEMHAAALAALPFKIPVAHIHGGELTLGAIDDALRHSITKLSHLHFVSTENSAQRVIQMGEEPWRVTISGAPALDNLQHIKLFSKQEMSTQFDLNFSNGYLLVTFHPVTLEYENTEWQICELLAALEEIDLPVLFTMPNADTRGRLIRKHIVEFTKQNPQAQVVKNLGTRGYFSAMKYAVAMVGNSSSGIIEAASFNLPVVNIGSRQGGRERGKNVVDTGYTRSEISASVRQVTAIAFRDKLQGLVNPYGNGKATRIIIECLKAMELNKALIQKEFYQ